MDMCPFIDRWWVATLYGLYNRMLEMKMDGNLKALDELLP